MHIKSISIEGFKTYKELTLIDDFDKGQNIILGKNGSGKSNIFDAIQFVLSDKYSQLHQNERQRLLHEGSGREIMAASVEIIFDNSDGRFPIDKNEVSIKRTIGLKKDEYFLDHKHNTKSEVMNLLESAGLSKSNPYYIVQQGQVRRLIKMKAGERLELFMDIAGTRTYDERRKESKKIMTDTDKRRTQIDEVIAYIEGRLSELEEEKKELKEFTELDAHRRCLEFTIYHQELEDTEAKLASIEGPGSEQTEKLFATLTAAKSAVVECDANIRSLSEELAKLKAQKAGWERDLERALAARTRQQLTVQAAQSRVEGGRARKTTASKELKELEKQVAASTAKLTQAAATLASRAATEDALKARLISLDTTLAALYDKQGRKAQFKSKGDRDIFLKAQSKEMSANIEAEKKRARELATAFETLTAKVAAHKNTTARQASHAARLQQENEDTNNAFEEAKAERDRAMNERKELWRAQSTLEGLHNSFFRELEKKESAMQFMMDKSLYHGLMQVSAIAEELKLKGVFGPLLNLISCEDKFRHCVETTAGNSLFNVVVDTDETASSLIHEMNKKKGSGRVTFIPLNRVSLKEFAYPKSSDVLPLIDRVTFEPQFRGAMLQVFGKTLVARDLAVAAAIASSHNFHTITLAGDQVNKKGALTGGYADSKTSRLQAHQEIRAARAELASKQQEVAAIKTSLDACDSRVRIALASLEKLSEKRTHLRHQFEQNGLEAVKAKRELAVLEDELARHAKTTAEHQHKQTHLMERLAAVQAELAADFVDQLSAADKAELSRAQQEATESKKKLLALSEARSAAETAKASLDSLLTTNLLKRQAELEASLGAEVADEALHELDRGLADLQVMGAAVERLEEQKKVTEAQLEAVSKELATSLAAVNKAKRAEEEAEKVLTKETKALDKMLTKRTALKRKEEDCTKKIRELGALPAEHTSAKYTKLTTEKLMKNLETVNGKLRAFSHVNKKAMEQYVGFTEQRKDLLDRKSELDKGRQAILDLIDHLDLKKDEAINRTFKGIAKHFSTVFSELVPDGKGTLVIQTRKAGEGEESAEEDEAADSGTKHYTGVSIKVSFSGSKAGDQTMLQLSGGQQSIVALSLIFAIQRCDPSPFYLFDEIDSNLDAVHRTSVARMIANQSKGAAPTQFICTTFRPEMLTAAHKFYGVTFVNKVSQVNVITKPEAKELILVVEKEMISAAKDSDK